MEGCKDGFTWTMEPSMFLATFSALTILCFDTIVISDVYREFLGLHVDRCVASHLKDNRKKHWSSILTVTGLDTHVNEEFLLEFAVIIAIICKNSCFRVVYRVLCPFQISHKTTLNKEFKYSLKPLWFCNFLSGCLRCRGCRCLKCFSPLYQTPALLTAGCVRMSSVIK